MNKTDKRDKSVKVRLTKEEKDFLDNQSLIQHRSVSEIVRMAVEDYFAEENK